MYTLCWQRARETPVSMSLNVILAVSAFPIAYVSANDFMLPFNALSRAPSSSGWGACSGLDLKTKRFNADCESAAHETKRPVLRPYGSMDSCKAHSVMQPARSIDRSSSVHHFRRGAFRQ